MLTINTHYSCEYIKTVEFVQQITWVHIMSIMQLVISSQGAYTSITCTHTDAHSNAHITTHCMLMCA